MKEKLALLICFISVVLGIILRALWMVTPFDYDEAYSWLEYSRRPWLVAISQYDLPNNHLLNSVWMKLISFVLGHSEWALRTPTFIMSLMALPLAYSVFKNFFSTRVALFSVSAIALLPGFVFYSAQARGYGQQVFWIFLWLWCLLHQKNNFWLVVSGVALVWTVPTGVYPLASLFLFILLTKEYRFRVWPLAWRTGVVLGGVYFLPILYVMMSGTKVATKEVQLHSLSDVTAYFHKIEFFWLGLQSDGLLILLSVLFFILLLLRQQQIARTFVASILMAPIILIFATGVIPAFERTWLWVGPFFVAVIFASLDSILNFQRKNYFNLSSYLASGFICLLGITSWGQYQAMKTNLMQRSPQLSQELRAMVVPGDYILIPQVLLKEFEFIQDQDEKFLKSDHFHVSGDWLYALIRLNAPVETLRTSKGPLQQPSKIFALKIPEDWQERSEQVLKEYGWRIQSFKNVPTSSSRWAEITVNQ